MPITGMGNLIINIISKSFKIMYEKPQYLVIFIFFVLFFPLEIIDMFLYALVNIFVVILNILLIFIMIIINILIALINVLMGVIFGVPVTIIAWIITPINWLLAPLGLSITLPTFPSYTLNPISYSSYTVDYYDINIFPVTIGSIIVTCLFDMFGLSTPLW